MARTLSGRLNAIRLRSGAQPEKAIWQQTISIFKEILWNQAIPNIQPQLTMLAGRQQKSLCLKTNFSRDPPLASVFLPELDYLRLVIMPLNGAIKLLRWLFCSLHKHSASRLNWVWHIFKFFGALSFFILFAIQRGLLLLISPSVVLAAYRWLQKAAACV